MTAGAAATPPRAPTADTLALAWNDARSLLPFWMAGVAAATLAGVTDRVGVEGLRRIAFADPHALSLAACIAIIIGLGAQSLGHEYSHRTLGLLLALPVSRRRVYLAKHAVLAAMVLPLAASLWLLGAFVGFPALPWLAAAAAMGLAPLCTMVGRSALAGAALSVTLPAVVLVLLTIVSVAFDGSADAERAARDLWAWTMLPLLAGSAVLGWRRFQRLEAIGGGGAGTSPAWWPYEAGGVRPRHPLWLLVRKEVRLQRMAFVMTMIFAAMSASAALVNTWRGDSPEAGQVFSVASAIYWLGLPVLVGSLAVAEERQLGTATWQLQLPWPAWQQWMVKAATVFGVASVLSVGAPLLVAGLFWPAVRPDVELAVALTAITTAASLYSSSLFTSALRAAIASLTGIPVILWTIGVAAAALGRPDFLFWHGRGAAWLTLVLIVVVLLVGFSAVNHRPEPPEPARIRIQLLTLAGVIGTGVLLLVTV
jgi:hypothetical protein